MTIKPDLWNFEDSGLCFKRGFDKLPSKVLNLTNRSFNIKFNHYTMSNKIMRNGLYFKKKYDVIFKCSSSGSSCIILDDRQYTDDSSMKS